ncbi:MAG: DUF2281 domain-containing protein [Candidatus Muproteobacteria bacterium RIFCSPHIGHO2_02_FULL_65_16]|uniref:DUF2281 domain-containing protein n=1 Tax=Candidatus Muproteobacteria bacterium RIFCSPHIGHO2_02_FULL_65_16 TaxID=1817766 RepID=A0A1F6TZ40_9PROT|nr:MAG: DUF2281 domain-containing protein [Candidatus Muproteobacteria bacterium RIFCSPHIGHO2_02_FULL_65_16]
MNRKELIKEIEQIPEPLLEEVYDFVGCLKTRSSRERMQTVRASESSLKKDRLKAEEDAAWRDL